MAKDDKFRFMAHHEAERYRFVDFEFGDKPIFSYSIPLFEGLFLSKYAYIDKEQRFNGKTYRSRYLYKPNQRKNVLRLIGLEQKAIRCKIGSEKWVDYTAEIGRLYGYPSDKIEAFIEKMSKK